MIYTELTRKAMLIAFKAHEGQVDRYGFPYIHHPLYVANMMKTEKKCIVALLHDVVEDSDITLKDLEKEGFPAECITAIGLLTRWEGEDYMDYIRHLKDDPIAKSVKLADLYHNSDESRVLGKPTEEDLNRWKKYKKSMEILKRAAEKDKN